MTELITRRKALVLGAASLGLAFIPGCIGGPWREDKCVETHFDVDEMKSAEDILSNPDVAEVIRKAREIGLPLALHTEDNPPDISGAFNMTTHRHIPERLDLGMRPILFEQTGTKIERGVVSFDVDGRSGGTITPQISFIKGKGNEFTVYSVHEKEEIDSGYERPLEEMQACGFYKILIIDGVKGDSRNISSTYVSQPFRKNGVKMCNVFPSAGRVYFTRQSSPEESHGTMYDPNCPQALIYLGSLEDLLPP